MNEHGSEEEEEEASEDEILPALFQPSTASQHHGIAASQHLSITASRRHGSAASVPPPGHAVHGANRRTKTPTPHLPRPELAPGSLRTNGRSHLGRGLPWQPRWLGWHTRGVGRGWVRMGDEMGEDGGRELAVVEEDGSMFQSQVL
ncbi:unnamed protein product [Arctogadus glacialis]